MELNGYDQIQCAVIYKHFEHRYRARYTLIPFDVYVHLSARLSVSVHLCVLDSVGTFLLDTHIT